MRSPRSRRATAIVIHGIALRQTGPCAIGHAAGVRPGWASHDAQTTIPSTWSLWATSWIPPARRRPAWTCPNWTGSWRASPWARIRSRRMSGCRWSGTTKIRSSRIRPKPTSSSAPCSPATTRSPTGWTRDDPGYDPVYWQDATGRTVVEDWTVGFMRAVGMRRDAWEGVLETAEGAKLFIPIVAVASLSSRGYRTRGYRHLRPRHGRVAGACRHGAGRLRRRAARVLAGAGADDAAEADHPGFADAQAALSAAAPDRREASRNSLRTGNPRRDRRRRARPE